MWVLFHIVAKHGRTGHHTLCSDNIVRTIIPLLLIKSADYEEQYVQLFVYQSFN